MNVVGTRLPGAGEVLRRMGAQEEDEVVLAAPPPIPVPPPRGWFGTRHVLAFMGFVGFANVYAMRVNLSVAIVAMVNSSAIPHANTSGPGVCPAPSVNSSVAKQDGPFVWDEARQGLILGSFFWGYVISNIIGGRLAELIGGKLVFGIGVLVTAVLTLVTPVVAKINPYGTLLIVVRVLEGLGEGVTFPAMNCLMSKWIPPLERSKMSGLIYAGSQFGTVISMPISGILCQSTFLGGWPSVFYLFGVLGLLWFIVWMLLIHSTPASHPRIALDERDYIQVTLNQTSTCDKAPPIPFRHILTSKPFWAILVVHVAQNWGFYCLLTELPTYMKNVLHLSIADNSLMSALPYLFMWLMAILSGQVADRLRSRGVLSTTTTRRIFNSIGTYGPMVVIVLVGYAGCNTTLAIFLLCLAVGLNGNVYSGYMNSHLDIAPRFAGTLMGFTNSVATIPGFLAPMVTGALISGKETLTQWRLVFWIAAIVYLIGNTFYVIFISGDEQYWNDLDKHWAGVQDPPPPYQYGTFGTTEECEFDPPPEDCPPNTKAVGGVACPPKVLEVL